MREFGPVRFLLGNSPEEAEAAKPYLGIARTQLGITKNLMALGGLTQGARAMTLPDGTVIICHSRMGQDTVQIAVPTVASVPQITTARPPQIPGPDTELPLLPIIRGPVSIVIVGSYWNGSRDQAAVWRDGELTALADGGTSSYAATVSDDGQIIYGVIGTEFVRWVADGAPTYLGYYTTNIRAYNRDTSVRVYGSSAPYTITTPLGSTTSDFIDTTTRAVRVGYQPYQDNFGAPLFDVSRSLIPGVVSTELSELGSVVTKTYTDMVTAPGETDTGSIEYWLAAALALNGGPPNNAPLQPGVETGTIFGPVAVPITGSAYTITLSADVYIDVAADGTFTVYGDRMTSESFPATKHRDFGYITAAIPRALSDDGAWIAGEALIMGSTEAVLWNRASLPMNTMDRIAEGAADFSRAVAVTDDGETAAVNDGGDGATFAWESGLTLLSAGATDAAVLGMAPSGQFMAGYLSTDPSYIEYSGFVWSSSGGRVDLPHVGVGDYEEAVAVSADGSVVVGQNEDGSLVMWVDGVGSIINADARPYAVVTI